MSTPSTSPDNIAPAWPPNAESYYRPALVAAVVASVGVIVGSFTPWLSYLMFTLNGLDFANWGTATLILGAISGLGLVAVMFWERTPFDSRWAVPVGWGIAVAGLGALTVAVISIVRIMTIPKVNIFGAALGVSAGWGLWLVAFSSAVMCVMAVVVATQVARSLEPLRANEEGTSWPERWRWAAAASSALIVVGGIVYASTHPWQDKSLSSVDSTTALPSFPSFPPSFSLPTITSSSPSEPPATCIGLPSECGYPSTKSSSEGAPQSPMTTTPGSQGGSVVVDGETLYAGDYAVCDGNPISNPTHVDIMIGKVGPGSATAKVSVGDTPQVLQVIVTDTDGASFIFDSSLSAGGPANAIKDGNSYTITGVAVSTDQTMSKRFELSVTCY